MKHKFLVITAIGLLFFVPQNDVHGIEIEITGNSNNDNEVSIENEQTTQVERTNNAEVENNIDVEANTGDNEANNNAGSETTIETGDIEETVEIENNVNHSEVTTECCEEEPDQITIANNTNGNNTVEQTTTTTTNVSVTQNAQVENNVNGTANTGNNEANGNTGNVSITTGSITASETIITEVNKSHVSVDNQDGTTIITIKNNTNTGDNTVKVQENNIEEILVLNNAKIVNNSNWDLNTGNNKANRNIGGVDIHTGDIDLLSKIINDVNDNWIETYCCDVEVEDPNDPEDPSDPSDPSDPPSEPTTPPSNTNGNGSSNGDGGGDNNGSNGAGAGGAILPATGAGWWLYATIANIAMLLMGLYLRLRAGRSPSTK